MESVSLHITNSLFLVDINYISITNTHILVASWEKFLNMQRRVIGMIIKEDTMNNEPNKQKIKSILSAEQDIISSMHYAIEETFRLGADTERGKDAIERMKKHIIYVLEYKL